LCWRWSRRRHPDRGKKWSKKRDFHRSEDSPKGWHFIGKTGNDETKKPRKGKNRKVKPKEGLPAEEKAKTEKGKIKVLAYYRNSYKKAGSYKLVKDSRSYFDGDEIYWGQRMAKGYGDISASKAKMLKRQEGKCAVCGVKLKNGDLMERHHIIPKKEGGEDTYKNLALMHRHCHDQVHGGVNTHSRGKHKSTLLERTIDRCNNVLRITKKAYEKVRMLIGIGEERLQITCSQESFMEIMNETAKLERGNERGLITKPRGMRVQRVINRVLRKQSKKGR